MARVQRAACGLVLLALCLGLVQPQAGLAARSGLERDCCSCSTLPWPPEEQIIDVSDEATLRDLARNAPPNTTLRLANGVYNMGDFLHITVPGLTIRAAGFNYQPLTALDFGGMVGGHFGVMISADDVTLADLTIRNCSDHCVSIQGIDRPTLYRLSLIDAYDQFVKVNPRTDGGTGSEDGLMACCQIAYTSTCPNEYTNGISAHDAHRWVVRDNVWRNIRTPGNTPCPVVLFWSGSTDTIVERNTLIDCFSGIAFGNASHSGIDHTGGIVRNNVIVSRLPHDVAVEMVHASGFLVAHNTALITNPYGGLTWGMEARYGESDGRFVNNLCNMPFWLDRDGATASASGNVNTLHRDWFVYDSPMPNADWHLRSDAVEAIDQVVAPPEVVDDWDGDLRPQGALSDVGADEVLEPTPTPTWYPSPTVPTMTPVAQGWLPMIWRESWR